MPQIEDQKYPKQGDGSLKPLKTFGPSFFYSLSAATMNFMRLRTLCIALLFLLPAAASAQTADEILAKVLAARGGLDKMRAINSERVSGQISFQRDESPRLSSSYAPTPVCHPPNSWA